jgi:hypothetical protein
LTSVGAWDRARGRDRCDAIVDRISIDAFSRSVDGTLIGYSLIRWPRGLAGRAIGCRPLPP